MKMNPCDVRWIGAADTALRHANKTIVLLNAHLYIVFNNVRWYAGFMAIYHLRVHQISRGKGQSAVAAAAYRHATHMNVARSGEIADYSRKKGCIHSEVALPEGAPRWIHAWSGDLPCFELFHKFRIESKKTFVGHFFERSVKQNASTSFNYYY